MEAMKKLSFKKVGDPSLDTDRWWWPLGGSILTQDDDRGGPVPNLFILSATDLNHGLCCRVLHLDLQMDTHSEVNTHRHTNTRQTDRQQYSSPLSGWHFHRWSSRFLPLDPAASTQKHTHQCYTNLGMTHIHCLMVKLTFIMARGPRQVLMTSAMV